ncbi:response regulator transcription factor [Streptomyces puniciscabiei]
MSKIAAHQAREFCLRNVDDRGDFRLTADVCSGGRGTVSLVRPGCTSRSVKGAPQNAHIRWKGFHKERPAHQMGETKSMSDNAVRELQVAASDDRPHASPRSEPVSNCSCGAPVHPYVIVRNGAVQPSDNAVDGDLVLWQIRKEQRKDLAHVPCLVSTWGSVLISQPAGRAAGEPELRGDVSDRERDIMNVLSRGFTNTEIAQELFISEKTVKNHINRLFAKLGARHRAEAMAIWLGLARTSDTDDGTGTAEDDRCEREPSRRSPAARRGRCRVTT